MITEISKTKEITERLKKEGKFSIIEISMEEMRKWNEEMGRIKRESRYKQAMSEIEASQTILTS